MRMDRFGFHIRLRRFAHSLDIGWIFTRNEPPAVDLITLEFNKKFTIAVAIITRSIISISAFFISQAFLTKKNNEGSEMDVNFGENSLTRAANPPTSELHEGANYDAIVQIT
ncbi:unnamed protein product [Angiostrongylus costaricensis]|uniref:Transmembrane protein n=1 Tax=Angiostrongylus costaricensis TaxID=334426 RepID=A0A0R3PW09_ANGCS|nr:unnamed protein product [Angiostrongylus costaricensis]